MIKQQILLNKLSNQDLIMIPIYYIHLIHNSFCWFEIPCCLTKGPIKKKKTSRNASSAWMQGKPSGPSNGGRVDTRMEGCHQPQRSQAFQQSWTARSRAAGGHQMARETKGFQPQKLGENHNFECNMHM